MVLLMARRGQRLQMRPNPPLLPPHPALPPVRGGSRLSGHTRTQGGNVCPLVLAGVRRSLRLTAGRWARRRCWRVRVRVRRPRVRRPAASVRTQRTLEPSRPRPSASLREYVWLACFHCAPAPAAPPRLPTLFEKPFAQQHLKLFRPSKFGSERSGVGPEFEKGDGRLRPSLQQRLPGAEGPPEGCTTDPRHAACGGPLPSSAEGPCVIFSLFRRLMHLEHLECSYQPRIQGRGAKKRTQPASRMIGRYRVTG